MTDYLKQNRVVLLSLSMIAMVACGGASAPEEEVMAEPVDPGNSHLVDLKLPNPNPEVITEWGCLLYTSPSPRDRQKSRMPSSA